MSGRRRVAVVTGAARGIGAATARLLVADGWAVGLVDAPGTTGDERYAPATAEELEQVRAACAELGGGEAVLALAGDVARPDDLEHAVARTVERFGGLDAAVAAAGLPAGGQRAWETDEATWHASLDVNLTGVWGLARAAVPALLARPAPRAGRFVAVASAAALGGLPQLAAYSAAKHGVLGLVRSMAAELAAEAVTVNAVCPGSTDTAMLAATARLYGLPGPEPFAAQQPLGRLLQSEEVAAAIGWLCSEQASGVTGAALPVDGGLTAVASWRAPT